jgi:hypothetical protein
VMDQMLEDGSTPPLSRHPGLDGVDGPLRHRCASVGLSKTPTNGSHP